MGLFGLMKGEVGVEYLCDLLFGFSWDIGELICDEFGVKDVGY